MELMTIIHGVLIELIVILVCYMFAWLVRKWGRR